MGRCGGCGNGPIANTPRSPLIVGEANELTRRTWVVAAAPDVDPLLQPRTALYVNGSGVQALLDAGILALA